MTRHPLLTVAALCLVSPLLGGVVGVVLSVRHFRTLSPRS